MPYKFFATKKEYDLWMDETMYTDPKLAENVTPVYPPEEIERLYAEILQGIRWAAAALINAGEDPAQIAAEAEESTQNEMQHKAAAYKLWEQYGAGR